MTSFLLLNKLGQDLAKKTKTNLDDKVEKTNIYIYIYISVISHRFIDKLVNASIICSC